jgi:Ran GTPase-activating protein (RanGAP) involved in mRNA processing and transport
MLELNLSGNNVGCAGAGHLAEMLARPACSLQYLHVDSCRIGADGAARIAGGLAENTNLLQLRIGNNELDDAAVSLLLTTANRHGKLADLHCGLNRIGCHALEPLLRAMSRPYVERGRCCYY